MVSAFETEGAGRVGLGERDVCQYISTAHTHTRGRTMPRLWIHSRLARTQIPHPGNSPALFSLSSTSLNVERGTPIAFPAYFPLIYSPPLKAKVPPVVICKCRSCVHNTCCRRAADDSYAKERLRHNLGGHAPRERKRVQVRTEHRCSSTSAGRQAMHAQKGVSSSRVL